MEKIFFYKLILLKLNVTLQLISIDIILQLNQ